jgi:hypothetical protein
VQDIASVYQPHSGLLPPHPPKNTNHSIRCHIPCHVCDKRGTFGNKVWERLTSEDSVFKKELDELSTKEYVNGLFVENDQLSHTKKTRIHNGILKVTWGDFKQ